MRRGAQYLGILAGLLLLGPLVTYSVRGPPQWAHLSAGGPPGPLLASALAALVGPAALVRSLLSPRVLQEAVNLNQGCGGLARVQGEQAPR